MRQPMGSTAPTTTAHAITTTISRSGRVTITPAAGVQLADAVARWERLTGEHPAAECGVTWCVNCWTPTDEVIEVDPSQFHHSATAVIPGERSNTGNPNLDVTVERFDAEVARPGEKAEAYLTLGRHRACALSPSQARKIAAAVTRAGEGAISLQSRIGERSRNGDTGIVSVVRLENEALQIGAVLVETDGKLHAEVFVNYVAFPSAGYVRRSAYDAGLRDLPDTWDITIAAADTLAAVLNAAADLTAAARAEARNVLVAS